MKITWDKYSTAYEAVRDVILNKYPYENDNFVVVLRTRHSKDDAWSDEFSELLYNDGKSWIPDDRKYIWDSDWWEGELEVELIAFAPVWRIRLGDEWKI